MIQRYRLWWLIASVLLLTACPLTDQNNDSSALVVHTDSALLSALTLNAPASCQAYREYVTEGLVETYLRRFESRGSGGPVTSDQGFLSDAFIPSSVATPIEVTRTNVQVAGVDEADIIKADSAGRIYSVIGEWLVIASAYPPETMRELARLKVITSDAGYVLGLYLDEMQQRAVVISSYWVNWPTSPRINNRFDYRTELTFIDIARPAKPEIITRLQVEGNYVDSRMIAGRLHLVSGFDFPTLSAVYQDPAVDELSTAYRRAFKNKVDESELTALRAELGTAVRRHFDQAPIEELLPASQWQAGTTRAAGLITCKSVLMPEMKYDPRLLTVTSVDSDGGAAAATSIMNNSWIVYASGESLYLAQYSGGWWAWPATEAHTALYKFDIGGVRPVYRATGSVDGWIKDRYSLDEYKGHMRVVTAEQLFDTEANGWTTSHHLTVLRDDKKGELVQTGAVSGFGKNESMRAVRLLGNRGFVVTFRQIDPLFAFDLSDPSQPRLQGELEIPGFSTYIHPVGEHYLLTIGRAGDLSDTQLQLFDVSDMAAPRLLHRHNMDMPVGYSWSAAEYDPHAFTYLESQGLLAIPLRTWNHQFRESFTGTVVYKIDTGTGIAELGRVRHDDLVANAYCVPLLPETPQWKVDACLNGHYSGLAYPTRAVFMRGLFQTYLYSVSNIGIKAVRAEHPDDTLGTLLFPVE